MHKGTLVHRTTVVCPICKLDDFVVNRRLPGTMHNHLELRCTCQRCGAMFAYEVDALGRALHEGTPARPRARSPRRSAV